MACSFLTKEPFTHRKWERLFICYALFLYTRLDTSGFILKSNTDNRE